MGDDLGHCDRDHLAFLKGGHDGPAGVILRRDRVSFVAARAELLRRADSGVDHGPGGGGAEDEVCPGRCWEEEERDRYSETKRAKGVRTN
jgi:hypothetical protein